MRDDYLWDRSGPVDLAAERLERSLRPLRHRPQKNPFQPAAPRRTWMWIVAGLSAAAIVAVAVIAWKARGPGRSSWEVARIAGQPVVDGSSLHDGARLAAAGFVETDGASQAAITIPGCGRIEVFENTKVTLVRDDKKSQRMRLARGRIRAVISAPPRTFAVETYATTANDLGCAYTLACSELGRGDLHVQTGWVGLTRGRGEVFVPAGASCHIVPPAGPGTPLFDDASEAFRSLVLQVDDGATSPALRDPILRAALAAARPKDAMSVWHLLTSAPPDLRWRVLDRLTELQPLPEGVTRGDLLRLDPAALDRVWDALGFGAAALFRRFGAVAGAGG